MDKTVSAQKVSSQKVSGHKVSEIDNMGQKVSIQLEMCPLEHEWPATYKVEAPLRVGFLEISRYSRHLSSAEPDVGCVYHHTIKR